MLLMKTKKMRARRNRRTRSRRQRKRWPAMLALEVSAYVKLGKHLSREESRRLAALLPRGHLMLHLGVWFNRASRLCRVQECRLQGCCLPDIVGKAGMCPLIFPDVASLLLGA